MNIEQLGVRIQLDGDLAIETIRVTPHEIEINGAGHKLSELHEMRDALSAAIDHAERMLAPAEPAPESKPVRLFTPDQVLTGYEELPVGTVVKDKDKDLWVRREDRWADPRGDELDSCSLEGWPAWCRRYAPVTIVSLP